MRAAPFGLRVEWSQPQVFELAARAAALTHGHPSGYFSAAALGAIVRDLSAGVVVDLAGEWVCWLLDGRQGAQETLSAINQARSLATCQGRGDIDASLRKLGEGWVGEEALAVAIYSVIVAEDFADAVRIGANHDGDSDSTASIAGQLWGAAHGLGAIRLDWAAKLDVFDVMCEVAATFLTADADRGSRAAIGAIAHR
ncbi:hypothetical protein BH11PSE2_BH11PSE2_14920 [soil metagenome]